MISEEKKKIVIENYFKSECNINTTIHDAYVKGFERGLSKAPQSERKTGRWILDRSGAYCCSKCMEPCATYVMMKPRDKFCKMCGSYNGGGQ